MARPRSERHPSSSHSRHLSFLPAFGFFFLAATMTVPAGGTQAPATASDVKSIVDVNGSPVKPSSVVAIGNSLFFLRPKAIWRCDLNSDSSKAPTLTVQSCPAPSLIQKIPVQEFNNLVVFPPHNSLVVLDKSGDLFEYFPKTNKWGLYRANYPATQAPDPDYVDLAFDGEAVLVLDPERNQIWRVKPGCPPRMCFPDGLPWRPAAGHPVVNDGIAMGFDGTAHVLKRYGQIVRYALAEGHSVHQTRMPYKFTGAGRLRPSRLIVQPGMPLYIVERENNRVLAVDRRTGKTSQFIFPLGSDLRGLLPYADRFWIIDGNKLVLRMLANADPASMHPHPRRIDQRLDGITMPVKGMRLPGHPGVFPGARRLYRFGVHHGIDFFNDPGLKHKVVMGTPAHAADNGKIVRCDANFQDMNAQKFSSVMSQCLREHRTSESNEDLFRGCQVWIDHGNGMMTRYAHLSKINTSLKPNGFVNRGDVIGYVGVSGTGQNLPGRARYPHLHFEILLDGRYLGWGLTPSETLGVYEDIFGAGK